ncbi:2-phosphosulfolactate phosphatase, partial [Candidatus Latescibacterota bacterium]
MVIDVGDYVKSDISQPVIIDLLRGSTTVVTLLSCMTEKIVPLSNLCLLPVLKLRYPQGILVGERRGRKIPGFTFSNSPTEIIERRDSLHGKTIIHKTTFLTRYLHRLKRYKGLLAGLVNLDAIVGRIQNSEGNYTLIPCGCPEDEVVAYYILSRLRKKEMSPNARTILNKYHTKDLTKIILNSKSAQTLRKLGYSKDIELALS